MVEVTLRFLIEEFGRVKGVYPKNEDLEDFLVKRTASHGIELLGLLTLHVSPIWVLAALADATGAGHALIEQIAESLKQEGLLERDAHFENLDQVLERFGENQRSTGRHAQHAAGDPEGFAPRMGKTAGGVAQRSVCESAESGHAGNALEQASDCVGRRASIGVCALLYAGGGHAGGIAGQRVLAIACGANCGKTNRTALGETLLEHYVLALNEISAEGFLAYWRKQFRPYLSAAALQFAPANESTTERLLRPKKKTVTPGWLVRELQCRYATPNFSQL